jgi:hypothetical protein
MKTPATKTLLVNKISLNIKWFSCTVHINPLKAKGKVYIVVPSIADHKSLRSIM